MTLPSASAIPRPEAWGYGARFDDLLVRLWPAPDTPGVRIVSQSTAAERIQTAQAPEEYIAEYGQVFARSAFDGGEGLDFAHRPGTDPQANRFWRSRKVDPFKSKPGQPNFLTLAHAFSAAYSDSTDTEPKMVVLPDDTVIYIEGNQVYEVTSVLGTPSRNLVDPNTGGTANVLGLAVLGDEVFAALGSDGIAKRASGGTWSLLGSSTTTDGVWAVKERIFSSNAEDIYEPDLTTGAPGTSLLTLPSGESWIDVIDAGETILAAASNGYIYSFQGAAGSVEVVGRRRMSRGEVVRTMAYLSGVLVFGTSLPSATSSAFDGALYSAEVDAAGELTNIQLEREWETSTASTGYYPTAMVTGRDSVYFTLRDAEGLAIWRFYLPTFGLAAVYDISPPSGVASAYGLGIIDRHLVATVGAYGLMVESDDFEAEGYLITPLADHYTEADKAWLDVRVSMADNFDNGLQVECYFAVSTAAIEDPDSSDWWLSSRVNSSAEIDDPVRIDAPDSRYMALMVKLIPANDLATAPEVYSVAVRSAVNTVELTVECSVNVSDRIELPHRQPMIVQGWGNKVFAELRALRGTRVEFETFNPPLLLSGVVDAVVEPVVFSSERGSAGLASIVRVIGTTVIATQGTTSVGEALGIELLGVMPIGV